MSNSTYETTSRDPLLFQVPSLDSTYGAILLGSFFGLILFGITLHQAYRYFSIFPKDRPFVKVVVWAVLCSETLNTALCMHVCYGHLVTNYFKPESLLIAIWSLDVMPIAAGLPVIFAQTFFFRRVYKFGHYNRIPALISMIFFVGTFAFCCAAAMEAFLQPSFEAFRKYTWLISAAFGMAILGDILLTTSLIVALRRGRTGYKGTDSLIETVILYTITTGLVTTVVNIIALLFALVLPDNLIYIGINIVAAKLYAVSLFAALNSRASLAKKTFHPSAAVYGTGGRSNEPRISTGPRFRIPTKSCRAKAIDSLTGETSFITEARDEWPGNTDVERGASGEELLEIFPVTHSQGV